MAGRIQNKIALLFTSTVLQLVLSCSTPTAEVVVYDTSIVREGDLIFRRGYGLVSDLIVARLNEPIPLSHGGIVVKDSYNRLQVIHTLSEKVSDTDGMQIDSIEAFLNESRIENIWIARYKFGDPKHMAEKARYYLQRSIPFDHGFNLNDTTAFYCSELLWHILKATNQPLPHNDHPILGFQWFFDPDFFDAFQLPKLNSQP